jgi:putative transcriptional regulator
MESLQGHFLVAAPYQLDPNFVQTVILVVQHTNRGAFGLILNCPTNGKGGIFWERVSKHYCLDGHPLYFGGPVTGPLMAVHTDPSNGQVEVLPDVFFTAKDEHIAAIVRQDEHPYKIFVGYVGWGPQQLDYEVEQGVWRASMADLAHVFSTREDLWDNLSKHILEAVFQEMFHIKYVPQDPLLN